MSPSGSLTSATYSVVALEPMTVLLASTDDAVVASRFVTDDNPLEREVLRLGRHFSLTEDASPLTSRAVAELTEYFEGSRRRFEVPVAHTHLSAFQQKVLTELDAVPCGQTVTYHELAERAGHPRSARAVGTALATNPLCVLLPCHRVLPTSGGAGGYAGGPELKRRLLELERQHRAEGG